MSALQPSQSEALETPRPFVARAAILLTIVLTAAVLALLLYYAVTSPTPNRVIVVRANSDWDGAQLLVEGGNLPQPQETTIMRAGNYVVPFFLWPGKYKLHVKSQGIEVYSQDFNLTSEHSQEIDLTKTGATTLPSTNPTTMPSSIGPSEL